MSFNLINLTFNVMTWCDLWPPPGLVGPVATVVRAWPSTLWRTMTSGSCGTSSSTTPPRSMRCPWTVRVDRSRAGCLCHSSEQKQPIRTGFLLLEINTSELQRSTWEERKALCFSREVENVTNHTCDWLLLTNVFVLILQSPTWSDETWMMSHRSPAPLDSCFLSLFF